MGRLAGQLLAILLLLPTTPLFVFYAILVRLLTTVRRSNAPRVVFGFEPLINIKYWSAATRLAGYQSDSFVFEVYGINKQEDFDIVFLSNFQIPLVAKRVVAFFFVLAKYDVLIFTFNGGPLAFVPLLSWLEPILLGIAGKKTVLWPYGSDAYSYRKIRDLSAQNALLISYPLNARKQGRIESRVLRWTKYADFVFSGFMAIDGIGRWDIVIPNFLIIDESKWITRRNLSNPAYTVND